MSGDPFYNLTPTLTWWMPHEGGAYALPYDFAAKLHDSGEIAIYFGDYETASRIVPVTTPAPVAQDHIPDVTKMVRPAPAKRGRRKGVVEFQGAT